MKFYKSISGLECDICGEKAYSRHDKAGWIVGHKISGWATMGEWQSDGKKERVDICRNCQHEIGRLVEEKRNQK